MTNMGYCRFRNTLRDLLDCQENMDNPIDDEEEAEARLELVRTCKEIADAYYLEEDYQ